MDKDTRFKPTVGGSDGPTSVAVIKKTSSKKVNKKPPKVVQPQKPNKTEKTSKVNK